LTPRRLLGGSWFDLDPSSFRAACRCGDVPGGRDDGLGFRIVLHLQKDPDR